MSTERTERVEMRLTPAEKATIRRASEHAGIDVAVAARQATLAWARKLLGALGAATLLLLLPSCLTSEVIYVDKAFSADEVVAIQRGAQMWHDADTNISFDLAFGATVTVGDHRRQIVRVPAGSRGAADASSDGETILLVAGTVGAELSAATAHELGHVLGLSHVPSEQGAAIMNAVRTAQAITPADLAEVRRVFCTVEPK